MQAFQVHYTSCRYGQSGFAGFQVRSASEGISAGEIDEVVKHSSYRHSLIVAGGDAFPVARRFYRLSSGRIALTQVVYTGTDYSGREGNFFAHTLILADEAAKFRPADCFSWGGWKHGLDHGDDDAPPSHLPTIDLSCSDDIGQQCNPTEFIKAKDGRGVRLEAMVRAVFFERRSNRSLVLRCRTEDAFPWIVSLQACFPPIVAAALPFSSYEYAPNQLPCLAGTVPGTEINLDQYQRNSQFFVFDDFGGPDSEIPRDHGPIDAYAQYCVERLRQAPRDLEPLFDYVTDLGCNQPDDDLAWAAQFFRLSLPNAPAPSRTDILALVKLAMDQKERSRAGKTFAILFPHVTQLVNEVSLNRAEISSLSNFLFKACKLESTDERRSAALSAWLKALLADEMPKQELAELSELCDSALGIPTARDAYLLSSDAADILCAALPKASPQFAKRIIDLVSEALKTANRDPYGEESALEPLIHALRLNTQGLEKVLTKHLRQAPSATSFSNLCQWAGLDRAFPQRAKLVGTCLAERDALFAKQVRSTLTTDCIIAEIQQRVRASSSPVETFLEHHRLLGEDEIQIPSDECAKMVLDLANRAKGSETQALVRYVLSHQLMAEIHRLNPESTQVLLTHIKISIPLNPAGEIDKDLLEGLIALPDAVRSKLQTPLALRKLLGDAADSSLPYPTDRILELAPEIRNLGEEDYELCLQHLLIPCRCTNGLETINHRELLQGLDQSYQKTFDSLYLDWLQLILSACCIEAFAKHLEVWLCCDNDSQPWKHLGRLASRVDKTASSALARRTDRDKNALWERLKPLEDAGNKRLKGLKRSVDSPDKKGVLGQWRNLFG